jgi:hypothetical protein
MSWEGHVAVAGAAHRPEQQVVSSRALLAGAESLPSYSGKHFLGSPSAGPVINHIHRNRNERSDRRRTGSFLM